MADGRHLKKSKIGYLRNGLTDLHEIRHSDANCASKWDRKLNFPTIKNQRWRTAAILKNGKSAIKQYLLMRRLVRVKSAIDRVGKVELYATVSTYFTISPNKTAKIILKNKNWLQFLFIVKAAVLKQPISKFYPQILSTEDSFYIYDRPLTEIDVIAISVQRRRHGNGRYGHGHTTFRSTMATNGFSHSTFCTVQFSV